MEDKIEILDKAICILLDNQKKFCKELQELKNESYDSIKNLVSYDDFVTASLENGIFVKEKNEIMKSNEYTVYTNIKQYNEKIHRHIRIVYENCDNDTVTDNYINCTKNEFEKLYKEK